VVVCVESSEEECEQLISYSLGSKNVVASLEEQSKLFADESSFVWVMTSELAKAEFAEAEDKERSEYFEPEVTAGGKVEVKALSDHLNNILVRVVSHNSLENLI